MRKQNTQKLDSMNDLSPLADQILYREGVILEKKEKLGALEREYVKLNSDVHLGWGWRIRDRIRSLEYDIRQQKSLIDSAQEDVYKLRARMRKVRPSYHDEVVDRLTDELIELLDGKNGYNSTSRGGPGAHPERSTRDSSLYISEDVLEEEERLNKNDPKGEYRTTKRAEENIGEEMDFDTNGNIIYHRENDEQDDQNFDFNTREDAYLQPSLFDEIPKKRKRIKKEQPTLVNQKEFKLSEEVLGKERDHSLSKRKSAFKIGDVSKKQIHKLERKHHKDKMRELRKST